MVFSLNEFGVFYVQKFPPSWTQFANQTMESQRSLVKRMWIGICYFHSLHYISRKGFDIRVDKFSGLQQVVVRSYKDRTDEYRHLGAEQWVQKELKDIIIETAGKDVEIVFEMD